MGKQKEFHHIRRLISRWASEIRLNNAFNYYDINILGEDIAKDLLSIIYNYNLVNLNEKQKNYPGIDLGDEKEKICFQITSRNDVRKIKEGLEKFKQNGAEIYTRGIRFFILKDEKRDYKKETTEEFKSILPGFEPVAHILTLIDLIRDIEQLYICDSNRFKEVTALLEREFSDYIEEVEEEENKEFIREPDKCPFKGLEVFKEQNHGIFFGRETEVEALMDRLDESGFLAVLGPSGSGKSSVVQAGLIPLIKEQAMVALFSPRHRPIEELMFALWRCYPENHRPAISQLEKDLYDSNNKKALHHKVREVLHYIDKEAMVIIIDQLEELFLLPIEEERANFIRLLMDALKLDDGPVSIIITMRSDFMGNCAYYDDLNRYITRNLFQLGPMNQQELKRAIVEPARLAGLHFDEGLVKRILDDGKAAVGILPLIEHALYELYRQGQGSRITFIDYEKIGKIEGALIKRAEDEFHKLDAVDQDILRKMFVTQLVQPGEGDLHTRRRATKEEIMSIDKNYDISGKILLPWCDVRLLTITRDNLRKLDFVDVAHEELIRQWPRVKEWMIEDKELARQVDNLRRATQNWLHENKKPDLLYRGALLLQIEEKIKTNRLSVSVEQSQFINAAIRWRNRNKKEKRRKRTIIISAFILIILISLIITTSMLINLKREEENTQYQNVVNIWESARVARKNKKPALSLHLFIKALASSLNKDLNRSIMFDMNGLWWNHKLKHMFPHEEKVEGALFNKTGTNVITWSDDCVSIWSAETGKKVAKDLRHDYLIGAVFNGSGNRILTWGSKVVKIWDWDTAAGSFTKHLPDLKHDGSVEHALFNKDETKILTWAFSSDNTVYLWDIATGKPNLLLKHPQEVNGALFNKDEKLILTWSKDGIARLWNAKTGKQLKPEFNHKNEIWKAAFNKTGSQIFTWSHFKANLWDVKTGKKVGKGLVRDQLRGYKSAVAYLDEEYPMMRIIDEGGEKIWNLKTGEEFYKKRSSRIDGGEIAFAFRLMKDEKTLGPVAAYLEICGLNNSMWHNFTGKLIGPATRFWDIEEKAILDLGNRQFLSWENGRVVKLYSIMGDAVWGKLLYDVGCCTSCFSIDKNKMAILTGLNNEEKLWTIDLKTKQKNTIGFEKGILLLDHTLNKSGKRILTFSVGAGTPPRLLNAETGKIIETKLEPFDKVLFSPDGTKILRWNQRDSHMIELFDSANGKTTGMRWKSKESLDGVVFSSKTNHIFTWDYKETGKLLNIKDGNQVGVDIRFPKYSFLDGATVNGNGSSVLIWEGNNAQLWDVDSGEKIGSTIKHRNQIEGAFFNSDSTSLITWSKDRSVRIWSTVTGEQLSPTLQHEEMIKGVVLSKDETLVLTWNSNKAQLWDIREGKAIGPKIDDSNFSIKTAFFNEDESAIIMLGAGSLLQWNLTVDYDFPVEGLLLQAQTLTGKKLNPATQELIDIPPPEWRRIKSKYIEFAKKHYKTCKYPEGNVFHRLFPKEAKKNQESMIILDKAENKRGRARRTPRR